jgi:hypothetical protein
MRLTELAHQVVGTILQPGDQAIDATAGNGHDTAFLARAVGPTGRVFAFDVQDHALATTAARLGQEARQVALIKAGHETMQQHVPRDAAGRIKAILFNLGYLPGGDKQVTTRVDTTIAALDAAGALLARDGLLSVMVYRGHEAGRAEAVAVVAWANALPSGWLATSYPALMDHAAVTPFLLIVRPMP